ncbi:MAG: CsiV family protein [Pseudomonadota bacterium]
MTRLTTLFLSILLFAGLAGAASKDTYYNVEVLVIEHRLPDLEGGEAWVKTDLSDLVTELRQAGQETSAGSETSTLGRAGAKLVKDGKHRLLAHRHWTQLGQAKSDAKPVRLQDSGQTLDGVVHVYQLSRSLYLDLNLALASEKLRLDRPNDAKTPVFRLQEHRRIRLQEIHYFDHPRFGVLVRVMPVGRN